MAMAAGPDMNAGCNQGTQVAAPEMSQAPGTADLDAVEGPRTEASVLAEGDQEAVVESVAVAGCNQDYNSPMGYVGMAAGSGCWECEVCLCFAMLVENRVGFVGAVGSFHSDDPVVSGEIQERI